LGFLRNSKKEKKMIHLGEEWANSKGFSSRKRENLRNFNYPADK
jgi:hypothetical protein